MVSKDSMNDFSKISLLTPWLPILSSQQAMLTAFPSPQGSMSLKPTRDSFFKLTEHPWLTIHRWHWMPIKPSFSKQVISELRVITWRGDDYLYRIATNQLDPDSCHKRRLSQSRFVQLPSWLHLSFQYTKGGTVGSGPSPKWDRRPVVQVHGKLPDRLGWTGVGGRTDALATPNIQCAGKLTYFMYRETWIDRLHMTSPPHSDNWLMLQ